MGLRRKKARLQGDVELNMAAMLDMAFQLLTFFILTFRPAPVEGQISLRMPPPIPITNQKGAEIGKDTSDDPLKGLERLVVSIFSTKEGEINTIAIGENGLRKQPTVEQELAQLNKMLAEAFTGTKFDEVVLQVGSGLKYEQLMQVIDICTRQKLANGERLSKLTFVELPDGSYTGPPAAKKTEAKPAPKKG